MSSLSPPCLACCAFVIVLQGHTFSFLLSSSRYTSYVAPVILCYLRFPSPAWATSSALNPYTVHTHGPSYRPHGSHDTPEHRILTLPRLPRSSSLFTLVVARSQALCPSCALYVDAVHASLRVAHPSVRACALGAGDNGAIHINSSDSLVCSA